VRRAGGGGPGPGRSSRYSVHARVHAAGGGIVRGRIIVDSYPPIGHNAKSENISQSHRLTIEATIEL
jgi:hypothetical protein